MKPADAPDDDEHPRRVDLDVVQFAVALGEPSTKRLAARRVRVAEWSIERGHGRRRPRERARPVAGWPTSRWITSSPWAARRSAARFIAIAWKGGTVGGTVGRFGTGRL